MAAIARRPSRGGMAAGDARHRSGYCQPMSRDSGPARRHQSLVGVLLRAIYLLTVGRDVTGHRGLVVLSLDRQRSRRRPASSSSPTGCASTTSRCRRPGIRRCIAAAALAGLGLGGTGVLAHRAAGLVFGALTIALMGVLGRRAAARGSGWPRRACARVYPLMIVVDGALMSETASTPLVILAAARGLVGARATARTRSAALLGVAIGVTALVRSEALLLLPLLAWPVAGSRRHRVAAAGGRLATLACVARDRALDDPQRDRLRPPRPDLHQRLDRAARRELLADLRRARTSASGSSTASRRAGSTTRRSRPRPGARVACDYARAHAGRLVVVVPVRILRTFSLYQPRRQVLFAEGRWVRGEQVAVAAFYLLALLAVAGAVGAARARHAAARSCSLRARSC